MPTQLLNNSKNKAELFSVFKMYSKKKLEALLVIATQFNENELSSIALKVSKPQTKNLILNYL